MKIETIAAYFTVCEEVNVSAHVGEEDREPGLPHVVVSYPDLEWDRRTVYRTFATFDESRSIARALAESLKSLAPKDGFGRAWQNEKRPANVEARNAIEEAVTKWHADIPASV